MNYVCSVLEKVFYEIEKAENYLADLVRDLAVLLFSWQVTCKYFVCLRS